MRIAYHGTSFDHFRRIVDQGSIGGGATTNWNPSEPNTVYLWDMEHCENADMDAFDNAKWSAEPAILYARECYRVVLEVDIEGLEFDGDFSCGDMDGAISIYGTIPTSRIRRVWYDTQDLSMIKILILSGVLNNKLFNEYNFTEFELEAARGLQSNCCYSHILERINMQVADITEDAGFEQVLLTL